MSTAILPAMSIESYQFRKATEQDFEALIELISEFSVFEKMPHLMVNSLERMKEEKEFVNGFVAIRGDVIVGYATFFFTYNTWSGKGMYMDDLYVKEEHRKQGIGKMLLELVMQESKASKCHKLRWQVTDWNLNAQEFYKSMGAWIQDSEYNCILDLDSPVHQTLNTRHKTL